MAAYQISSHVCLYAPLAFSCRVPCLAYCIFRVYPLPRSAASKHFPEPIARHELMVASIVFYGGICMIYLRTIVK